MAKKAIIVGAGVAGLTAAYYLEKDGYTIDIIEQSDRIGGRMKTDEVDGFLLDHGFQILLDAYPECQRLLNYKDLDLKRFASGAIILHSDGSRSKVGDPRRDFWAFFPTLFAKMGSWGDKFRLLRLANKLNDCYIDDLFSQPEEPTATYLNRKFGEQINKHFFYPFLRGIMLDKDLQTSNRVFDFVFKMFGKGYATVPAHGMQSIPQQLSDKLQRTTIFLNSPVVDVSNHRVTTAEGQVFEGDKIILATEGNAFAKSQNEDVSTNCVSNTTVYFSMQKSLGTRNYLVLNASDNPLVNHLVQMDNISQGYVPKDQHLVACSLVGDHSNRNDLEDQIKKEMRLWFGVVVDGWKHIKTYHIRYALPNQSSVSNDLTPDKAILNDHTFMCGDHLLNGSINAAMKSGRQVAELIATSGS